MWRKDREFLDAETGAHVQVLRNSETGAEHITQIMLGHTACPHCGRVHGTAEEVDPRYMVALDLAMLDNSHERMLAYAAKYKVKMRGAR